MPQGFDSAVPGCGADYYLEQAAACRAIADLKLNPTHRRTFLRLAWHWRSVAKAVSDLPVAPANEQLRHV